MSLVLDGVIARAGFSQNVSLTIEAGETVGIVGRNGAGKSTLLHTVAGLCPLGSGSLSFDGAVWDAPGQGTFVVPERRGCAVVFQDLRLFPHMTCLDNVAFALQCAGVPRGEAREAAAARMESFGIASLVSRRASDVSGGEAQRVALARSVVMVPKVLLLDEPLSAVDAGARRELREFVRHLLSDYRGICLYVTHSPDDLEGIVDRTHGFGSAPA